MKIAEAEKNFAMLVNKVYVEGISVDLQQDDKIIAQLTPATPAQAARGTHMQPIFWLRLEGVVELTAACWLYTRTGFSWYLFAALFLAPDLGMLGYLAGPRVGAWTYNIVHTYALAIPLIAAGVLLSHPAWLAVGLIWCAHIAFDRMLGFGLKSVQSFKTTHLGPVGKP